MNLNERIKSFSLLGEILRNIISGEENEYSRKLNKLIDNQQNHNPWFTRRNVRFAIKAIADELTFENLTKWTDAYPGLKAEMKPLKVGVIMAGNIPLVGFHDFLSVLITGNDIIVKTSSKDPDLIVMIGEILCALNQDFKSKITFTKNILSNFDAVIASGSNNSSRYFEYYFGKYPNIIRKNRNSIAIIEGDETDQELKNLGTDIFAYFGLGCRNISKIFIPNEYDFHIMIRNWNNYSDIINHNKYANNFICNKAVCLVNKEKFLDTGFLLMKEESKLASPVAVLHFEYYEHLSEVEKQVKEMKDKIQCIEGRRNVEFGKAQLPRLWDYADGKDTIEFLLKKIVQE